MKERCVDIPAPGGAIGTFITHPSEHGPFPAVILYMDVWGVREELYDIARRIATVGYYCMVPDFYYRQGRVRNAFRNKDNRMISLDRLDPQQQEIVRGPLDKLTDAMVIDDTGALRDFIGDNEPVRPGAMGCTGYCMGGRHVFRVAGTFPERFKAMASMHGSWLVTDKDDSPHRLAHKLQGELYCGFAECDRNATPQIIDTLDSTMSTCAVNYRREVHRGAKHGYALPDRDVYDKQAANRDWEHIFRMFSRQLAPAAC